MSLRELPPEPFDDVTADALARRADELVEAEVKPADFSDDDRDYPALLSDILRTGCSWRLDAFTYSAEESPPQPEIHDVERRVREARDIANSSSEAAASLMWSAIEDVLLWIAQERGIASTDSLPPCSVVQ